MFDLKKIILERASFNTLHHLYLMQNPWEMSRENFNFNIENFLLELHERFTGKKISLNSLLNAEDLLFIKKNEEKEQFLLEDFAPLFQFIQYKAQVYPRRIVVIYDADRLTDLLINKLLKVLEEPPIAMTIFLLNSANKKLLPTLESRANKLKWGTSQTQKEAKLLPQFESIHELLEELKSDRELFPELVKGLMHELSKNPKDYSKLNEVQTLVKQYELTKTFHNSSYEVALLISSLLTESK